MAVDAAAAHRRDLGRWYRPSRGDVDTIVAQLGVNIAQAIIPVALLAPAGVPTAFSVGRLVPGYALGFLVGSGGLVALAHALRRREGRADVTAHAYGNNVPGIIAFSLAIVLPVYLQTRDPARAADLGAAAVLWAGAIKLAAAPFARAIRRLIPVPASMTVFGAAMYSYLALVLLQRLFDDPVVGLVAFAIVGVTVLARVPVTRWRVPPFLVAWLVPLALGVVSGYVRPAWTGLSPTWPLAFTLGPLRAMRDALPFMSVIAPIASYEVLQVIAAVEGGAAAGDDYDARAVLACDGIGTVVAGAAGSVIPPIVYAMHPAYKAIGARIAYAVWTPLLFLGLVASGLTVLMAQLFPWSILAALIAYVTVGVGTATLARVDRRYWSAVLLGFVLPCGAVVSQAMGSALSALGLSAADPSVQQALNRSIYWASVQGLGSGFIFLVLVVAALVAEAIDRRFERAARWCLLAAGFSWIGLMHSTAARWGAQPAYAAGWLAAAAVVYSARWWRER